MPRSPKTNWVPEGISSTLKNHRKQKSEDNMLTGTEMSGHLPEVTQLRMVE